MSLQANRAHTYLGLREKEYHVSGDLKDIYPDFVMMANSFGVKAKRVSTPEELRPAIQVTPWLHPRLWLLLHLPGCDQCYTT